MTTNKQALRQTAEKAQEHGVFNMDIHSETLLALLDELEAAESLAKQQGHIAVALFDEVTTLRRNADDKAPELRSQLEEAEKRIAEQAGIIAKQEKWIRDVEATMISATDRAEAAEKLAENLLCSLALALRQYDDFGQIRLEVIEEAELEIQKAAAAGINTKGE